MEKAELFSLVNYSSLPRSVIHLVVYIYIYIWMYLG